MNHSEIILYKTEDGAVKIDTIFQNETIWLTQSTMADLFDVKIPAISKHLKNIFESGELVEKVVVSILENTTQHGAIEGKTQTKPVKYYNLDAIIAVGYRVNSKRATQFRIWATAILKEYIIKGFAMDDERLKNDGTVLTKQFFEELLSRIREIRLSERKFYQKITDIYATAIDYDRTAETTKKFFTTVQNKLHWAIHGQTAAEVIKSRADAGKNNMGLTNWKDSPDGKIQKFDVSMAKNYLSKEELSSLERMVSAYLDIAEDMATRRIPMTMEDWAKRLDRFIEMTDRETLSDAGKITNELAKEFAEAEFEKYRIVQDQLFESDFDRFTQLEKKVKKNKS